MQDRRLAAIRDDLLSDANIERLKAKLVKRLRRPAADAANVRKLEAEIANLTETTALGIRSPALLERLPASESA